MSTVPKEYLDLLPAKDLSTVVNDTERNAQWLHDTKARGKQKGVKYSDKLKVLIPELKKRLAKTKGEDEKTAIEAAIAKAEGALMSGYTRASVVEAAPYDGWKDLKPGRLPTPIELEDVEGLWKAIAERIGHDADKGVEMRAPIIGGRKRYHHRPLRSYHLSNNRTLTITTDELEAKTWNNLKAKRHPSMPRIYDVFSIKKKGEPKAKLWAIVHEQLVWPVEKDWDLFVDSFFKWRAMEREALSPAKATDLEGFLRWVIDPETADPTTTQKHRIEVVLPWKMTRQRRDDVADRRKKLFALPDLEAKIKWAKSALKYLHQNKVHFRDFDPSNLAMTVQGDRAVVTNLAESRSIPTKTGRTGRVKGSTVEELQRMDIKDLDRMAFGVVDDEIVELDPKEIRIQYFSDLDNPKHKFRMGGYSWLNSVDLEEPVDVEVHQDGHFYLADGHHRWFAASKLGKKLLCKVIVKANPVKFITEGPSEKVR